MQLKLLLKPLLITSGIVGILALSLTLTPHIAQADSSAVSPSSMTAVIDQLELTPDQETQLAALRRDTRSQIQAIVQPNQRQQFKTTWQQGSSFRESVSAMNLTPDQRQQVRSLLQSTRQQAKAILTESQRQELKQILQERLDSAL
jgi:periplasmic protein CpxP/Spy